jgi:hypothetical protein
MLVVEESNGGFFAHGYKILCFAKCGEKILGSWKGNCPSVLVNWKKVVFENRWRNMKPEEFSDTLQYCNNFQFS